MPSFHVTSRLHAPPARVWAHATSMAGINEELMPLLRMTHPPDLLALEDRDPPLGVPLFRSVILLFGVVPIDYDDVTLVEIDPGRRFLERSPTMSQRAWQHERTIDADGDGCRVTDRITFTPKLPGAGVVLAPLLGLVFANRHRNLVKRFGGEAGRVVRG